MIITRKTDNDLYKFTMGNAIYHLYPDATAEYKFHCRTPGVDLARYADTIAEEINHYCKVTLTRAESDFLTRMGYFSPSYLQLLKRHRSDMKYITIDTYGPELIIRIKGPWVQTILDEVPILAIISEVYMTRHYGMDERDYVQKALERLDDKTINPPGIAFADFGTRRRYSKAVHREIIKALTTKYSQTNGMTHFTGTSNVALALDFNLKPIGTMAHEWLQAGQALTHPANGQKLMLNNWLKVYNGALGIALTDVIGVDAFLKDFDTDMANAFTGVRHDSGDPDVFAQKMIDHYKTLGIDPVTRTIIFSDGLDFDRAGKIRRTWGDKITCLFGIGTKLTNDIPGTTPLQIVLKLVGLNGLPVAKISDSPGKGMCENEHYVKFLKSLYL